MGNQNNNNGPWRHSRIPWRSELSSFENTQWILSFVIRCFLTKMHPLVLWVLFWLWIKTWECVGHCCSILSLSMPADLRTTLLLELLEICCLKAGSVWCLCYKLYGITHPFRFHSLLTREQTQRDLVHWVCSHTHTLYLGWVAINQIDQENKTTSGIPWYVSCVKTTWQLFFLMLIFHSDTYSEPNHNVDVSVDCMQLSYLLPSVIT